MRLSNSKKGTEQDTWSTIIGLFLAAVFIIILLYVAVSFSGIFLNKDKAAVKTNLQALTAQVQSLAVDNSNFKTQTMPFFLGEKYILVAISSNQKDFPKLDDFGGFIFKDFKQTDVKISGYDSFPVQSTQGCGSKYSCLCIYEDHFDSKALPLICNTFSENILFVIPKISGPLNRGGVIKDDAGNPVNPYGGYLINTELRSVDAGKEYDQLVLFGYNDIDHDLSKPVDTKTLKVSNIYIEKFKRPFHPELPTIILIGPLMNDPADKSSLDFRMGIVKNELGTQVTDLVLLKQYVDVSTSYAGKVYYGEKYVGALDLLKINDRSDYDIKINDDSTLKNSETLKILLDASKEFMDDINSNNAKIEFDVFYKKTKELYSDFDSNDASSYADTLLTSPAVIATSATS